MSMRRAILVLFGLLSYLRAMPALAAETTLYVGKHFEVRDHDQPTKYVFNGDTRIARITGSLSTNTRIQRFRLRSGWNLLSLAVSATNASDQLQRPDVINSARAWNPQTGDYSTVPQVGPAGTVVWVNATTNTTLAVVGTYADPVHRQIAAGATYLASTGLEAWAPTLPPSVAAWSFDPGPSSLNAQPTWHARLTGDLSSLGDLPETFPPGRALYVINPAPFELEIPDPALRIRYYHQDHLGSSSVMTDADGALVEETAFYPFGIPRHEHRLRQIEEAYKFTQKERDRESGLLYFEARYVTASLARFAVPDPKYAQPDTLIEADAKGFFSNPQKLNLYAYARNNPLNHVDPTGLDDEAKGKTVCKVENQFIEDLNKDIKHIENALERKFDKCDSMKSGSAAQEECYLQIAAGQAGLGLYRERQYKAVEGLRECVRKERDKPPPSPSAGSPMPILPPLYDPINRVTRIIIFAKPGPPPSPQPSPIPTPPPKPSESPKQPNPKPPLSWEEKWSPGNPHGFHDE